jgi:hypothetical protein
LQIFAKSLPGCAKTAPYFRLIPFFTVKPAQYMQQNLLKVTAAFGRRGRYEKGYEYDGEDKKYEKTAFWPSLHTLFNFALL